MRRDELPFDDPVHETSCLSTTQFMRRAAVVRVAAFVVLYELPLYELPLYELPLYELPLYELPLCKFTLNQIYNRKERKYAIYIR
jgi:hypothetical protein